jgi:hypothetical protein
MLLEIHENVDERVPCFAGRAERVSVIAIAPNSPVAPGHTIHRARQTDRQAGHSAGKRDFVMRLDDEVQVIGLHGEVNHPEPRARGVPECASKACEYDLSAQIRNGLTCTHRNMHGMVLIVFWPSPMGNRRASGRPLAPRPFPPTAPPGEGKLELSGLAFSDSAARSRDLSCQHLEKAILMQVAVICKDYW